MKYDGKGVSEMGPRLFWISAFYPFVTFPKFVNLFF